MEWTDSELETLQPVLDRLVEPLQPVTGSRILVLGSAGAKLAQRLARMGAHEVVVLRYDDDPVFGSKGPSGPIGAGPILEFFLGQPPSLPFPAGYFDGVVSDVVVFPSRNPAQVNLPELALVLKPGGSAVLTGVVVTNPLETWAADELREVGFDYSSEATPDDYELWLSMAGLEERQVHDLTPLVQPVWQARADACERPRLGYQILLDDPDRQLGHRIFYFLATGRKPVAAPVAP